MQVLKKIRDISLFLYFYLQIDLGYDSPYSYWYHCESDMNMVSQFELRLQFFLNLSPNFNLSFQSF